MLNTVHAECRQQTLYAECHYAECRYAEWRYAEWRYADCRYAECRDAFRMCLVFPEEFEIVFKNIKMKQTLNSIKKARESRTMKLYRDIIHSVP
jgi:hypothetical protein